MAKMILKTQFDFDAAHALKHLDSEHKCHSLHGHCFKVIISIKGEVKNNGWVMDFGEIKEVVSPFIEQLDHACLNEVDGLTIPTSENIALWLWEHIKPQIPELYSIEIFESSTSSCVYMGE